MLTPPPILVGRERELHRLSSALALVPVAVIAGIAGVGKSTLVRAHAARWTGPVAVVSARTAASVDELAAQVQDQLRAVPQRTESGGERANLARLWALLDAHGALLVVDDLQRWEPERRADFVRSALSGLVRGRLVAVSRELVSLDPGDPDRLELRLDGLDRVAAKVLWETLVGLYGPTRDFEAAWQRSRGNPFRLRQAHVGRSDDRDPLDDVIASLATAERALATLIAVSQSPLPREVIAAANAEPAALQALATRLMVEVDGNGHYAPHALVRELLLRGPEVAGARRRLATALQTAPGISDVLRVREAARQLRALGADPAIAALVRTHAHALVNQGEDDVLLHELDALAPEVRTPALERLRARVRCHGLDVRRAYLGLASAVDEATASAETRLCLAGLAIWAGELDRARALLDGLTAAIATDGRLRERSQLTRAWAEATRGDRTTAIAPHTDLAHALRLYEACLADRTTEAADLASELITRLQARPATWSRSIIPALCAIALARGGRFDEAERAVARMPGPSERLSLRWARAVIAGERGERIAAIGALSALLPEIDRCGLFGGAMWTRVVLIRLGMQLGRRGAALATAAEARGLARRHGSTAFDAAIAHAEGEDLLTFADAAELASIAGTPAARLRLQLRAALAAACDDPAGPPARVELPDGVDFALDHAALAVAHAVAARRRGQARLAADERARASELAERCGADRDLVARLLEQLDARDVARPGDPPMLIDATRHELRVGALRRSLSSRVSLRALLYAFASANGQQLSRDAIAHALWSTAYDPLRHESSLKSSIRRLRSLLLGTGAAIESVRDGYRLVLPPETTFIPPAELAIDRQLAG